MTTLDLSLIALSATLWILGGYTTNMALVATFRQRQPLVMVMLIWPFAVLYAMVRA